MGVWIKVQKNEKYELTAAMLECDNFVIHEEMLDLKPVFSIQSIMMKNDTSAILGIYSTELQTKKVLYDIEIFISQGCENNDGSKVFRMPNNEEVIE